MDFVKKVNVGVVRMKNGWS